MGVQNSCSHGGAGTESTWGLGGLLLVEAACLRPLTLGPQAATFTCITTGEESTVVSGWVYELSFLSQDFLVCHCMQLIFCFLPVYCREAVTVQRVQNFLP